MERIDTYSRRKSLRSAPAEDVYEYEILPKAFRVQVVHILADCLGFVEDLAFSSVQDRPNVNAFEAFRARKTLLPYDRIVRLLTREYGRFSLAGSTNPCTEVKTFLLDAKTDECLDLIEVSFREARIAAEDREFRDIVEPEITAAEGVAELNRRFQQHSLGYRLENGQIVKFESLYLHQEVVRPVLSLLADQRFSGPLDEFLAAHEHFRHASYKECLNESLKAFESTLKVVCKVMEWDIGPTATARALLEAVFTHEIIPVYLTSHFTSLKSLLQSGVPTVRNRESGHGQGDEVKEVPEYLASFSLNTTASCIALLVSALKEKES